MKISILYFYLSYIFLEKIYFKQSAFRCPLHTNDAQINLRRILENAQKAKQDLGNVEIKFDPTKDIGQYYA